ncbi:MAG: YidC/Oxa1 family insertase periplasmic-domain containing protein [Planctomycetales bacterium]|nr:YidC/Oxa1 family insertase periplasmic-domain containing protein [Planctomycetales bacterium]
MCILIGYQAIESRLNPQPPAAEQVAEAADAEAAPDGDAPQAEVDAATSEMEANASDTTSTADTDAAATESDAPADGGTPNDLEQTWTTLGTLDRDRPEKLLVWFTNRGAAVECIALNDSRFTDLDDDHGYLGYLALEESPSGLRIGAVGDGTPAAAAIPTRGGSPGLQAGDIITQIDDTQLVTKSDFAAWLESSHPQQQVKLTVTRGSKLEFTATLGRRPLEVIHPESGEDAGEAAPHPLSYLVGLQQLGKTKIEFGKDELPGLPSLRTANWEQRDLPGDSRAVEFHYVLTAAQLKPFGVAGPLRIIKRYELAEVEPAESDDSRFHLKYRLSFRNESPDAAISYAYRQFGPTGLPLEGWWYTYKTHPTKFGGAGVRDVISKSVGGSHKMFSNPDIVKRLEKNPTSPATPMYENESFQLAYIGVDAQYFTSALVADTADGTASVQGETFADALALPIPPKDPIKSTRTDVTFELISPLEELAPGAQVDHDFRIFAGPKKPSVLAAYGLGDCITYGWFPYVAKPLQWVLHTFYSIFHNYGIAIILLTVMVRGMMYPLGRQQALNAQKMQQLGPEMKRIAEEYKNDLEKRAAAQRELFQKHNYNPLAGCLPMFFQLPIFVGLYRALSVDIELRQAALIPGIHWCSNLAGPDQLIYWEPFMPAMLASRTGWLGPYLNILPLISVTFMMIHQKLFTPPPTDEQQEMQMKVMKFMMLFMAFMFFRVPAGLCLYFITSSAWGLAERLLLPKPKLAADGTLALPPAPVKPASSPSKGSSESGGGGLLSKLREMADEAKKAQPQSEKRNKSKRR